MKTLNEMTDKEVADAVRAFVGETTIAKTKTLQVVMGEMPMNAVLSLLGYGTQRRFNDAVGGQLRGDEVYTPAMKVADAEALLADYKDGVVSKRREGGASVPDDVRIGRKIMRKVATDRMTKEQTAAWRKLDADAQLAKLDAWIEAGRNAAFDEAVKAEIAREKAEKVRAATLGDKVSIDI